MTNVPRKNFTFTDEVVRDYKNNKIAEHIESEWTME